MKVALVHADGQLRSRLPGLDVCASCHRLDWVASPRTQSKSSKN